MNIALIVIAGLAAWLAVSAIVALGIGRAIKIADRKAAASR